MSPVSTITLITENSFWQNAEGKKQKAREVSNELRVYSSFIPQRLINSSDSETWKGSGKEVMLKQTVCRWSFKSHPFLFFCKHPLAV